jgi:hypothetical protein
MLYNLIQVQAYAFLKLNFVQLRNKVSAFFMDFFFAAIAGFFLLKIKKSGFFSISIYVLVKPHTKHLL